MKNTIGFAVRVTVRVVAVSVALGSLACGPDEGPERSAETTMTDSAGIEIVTNGFVGSLEFRIEETLRLGRVDGEGPELFSRIAAVRWGPEGRIHVGNGGSASVRVFDADGTFLTEFGGFGGGPTQLPVMLNDVIVAGDSVVLIDWQQNGRVLLFDAAGEFLSGRPARDTDGMARIPVRRTENGWLMTVTPRYRSPELRPGERLVPSRDVQLTPFDVTEPGPVVHRIDGVPVYGTSSSGEMGVDWRLFEGGTGHTGFDASGRLYATSRSDYRIDIFELGQLVRSVRRDFAPRAITLEDVEEYRRLVLSVIDTLPMPEEMRPGQREQLSRRIDAQTELGLPDVLEPFSGLVVSPDGSFWVGVRTDVSPAQAALAWMWRVAPNRPSRWELYDPRGMLLGAVDLPPRYRPEAANGFEVIGVQTDELGVEYVVRYDAVPQSEGPGGRSAPR